MPDATSARGLNRPSNLPAPVTSFIGRDREIADVRQTLRAARLVTLVGIGGVGKTRLACEVAACAAGQFADGTWLVELASLTDATRIADAIAAVLDVREQAGRPLMTSLIEALRRRQILLILDNCEHLLASSATVVIELLAACPHLTVLATSRSPLRVYGEHEYAVQPLTLPDLDPFPAPGHLGRISSIALFTHRARAVRSRFRLTERNARSVAEICHRLDGLPLAIELAAARTKLLDPPELLRRLDARFPLLSDEVRGVPARHLALHETIGWSYDLLGIDERILFRRLAAFAGGWDIEAAERVCAGEAIGSADILNLLTHLVDQSLVVVDDGGRATRYRFLESVREYSAERLAESGEGDVVRGRHLAWCAALAERAEPELLGPEQATWYARLQEEHPNIRAALAWGERDDDAILALRLAGALGRFWQVRGHLSEGRQAIECLLSRAVGAPTVRAKAYNHLGTIAYLQGDIPASHQAHVAAYALRDEVDDPFHRIHPLFGLAETARVNGDVDGAITLLQQALDEARAADHRVTIYHALYLLANARESAGRPDLAVAALEEAIHLIRAQGDTWLGSMVLHRLAFFALVQQDGARAVSLISESLALRRAIDDTLGTAHCIETLAWIAARQGAAERAARLFGTAEALRERVGAALFSWEAPGHEQAVAAARAQLDEPAFAAAWAAGRAMSVDDAIDAGTAIVATPPIGILPAACLDPGAADSGAGDQGPAPLSTAEADARRVALLTPRELDIVGLIARGYSDREIAASLAIRPRTAETHVKNIREKLGFRSRGRIAAWAAALNLASPRPG